MTDARAAAVLWHKGRMSPFLLLKRGGNENRRAAGSPLPRDATACGHPGAAQNIRGSSSFSKKSSEAAVGLPLGPGSALRRLAHGALFCLSFEIS